jgi:site-specific DNA-methyltransferase (cytosine-N4-specific)
MQSIVQQIYEQSTGPLTNQQLYDALAERGYSKDDYQEVGQSGKRHNLFYRRVRWVQQSLKKRSLVLRTGKNAWELSTHRKIELRSIGAAQSVIAMSTSLGIAIWGKSEVIGRDVIDEPVHLILSSPPYPLKVARAYGNPVIDEYIDFLSMVLEPWIDKLAPGGSIALNVSNDIFEDGSPARSTYLEEMTIALKKRFGLHLMDRMPWVSNKAPGPIQWASLERTQLNVGYEHIIWFTNDPFKCFSNNQRVLQEHSEQHKRLMAKGGMQYHSTAADGNYVKKVGAYGAQTKGRIPTNVLQFSNYCKSGRQVTAFAKSLGMPAHAAKFPVSLCNFLIEFLTQPGQLVADIFSGTLTVGESAEGLNRRWVCVEMMWEYIKQSFPRFERFGHDVYWNPSFLKAI